MTSPIPVVTPIVNSQDKAAALAKLHASLPGYTPGWSPQEGTASSALMHIFARYMEIFVSGLNQVPERSFMAFLDMLGTSLLPAQGARAPLVFSLMEQSPVDSTLPANSQVAAPAQPIPPSLLTTKEKPPEVPQPAIFATTQAISLTRARLAALYSVKPDADEYADHTSFLTQGFTLFADWQPVEHALYLGHNHLFALASTAEVHLSFDLGALNPASRAPALEIAWEYLSHDGWLPLTLEEDGDQTAGLTQDGQVQLHKMCGPDAKEETIDGHTSFWLRGRLLTPLTPLGYAGVATLPMIDTVQARVGFTKSDLLAEVAYAETLKLDTTKEFYPFGQQAARYTTFYLASKEVFQRRGARVRIAVKIAPNAADSSTTNLPWEYHDGKLWRSLESYDFVDETAAFTQAGSISFFCPPDWGESTVNGVKNYWLRVRLTDERYGTPMHIQASADGEISNIKLIASTLKPPIVSSLRLAYTYLTEPALLDHCLAFNDFNFSDHSHACRWPRQTFEPFQPISDRQPALYFGFDQPLPSGLISLYLQVPSEATGEVATELVASDEVPAFVWEYHSANGWTQLGVLDETLSFQRDGMIQFIGPADAIPSPGPGGDLYRLRARLKQGERLRSTSVRGIWLNAVWGTHQFPVMAEALGDSNGNPHQTFYFRHQHVPVLEGEVIEIREWAGRGAEWETVVQDVPAADLRFEHDLATNSVKAVWVRWHTRPHLFDSGPSDRHCMIERAIGWLRFGDYRHGRVPPAGARVIASYGSGGGLSGNVPAGAITELRTGVPYLSGFTNPAAATGGAAVETLAAVRARGPQRLRHRDRAVSAQDFEWLAREASPALARVRCLPITGPVGKGQRGWVTLVIVPYGEEAQPRPTAEMQRRVRDHLATRVPATIARHIWVIGPQYVPISIVAEIVPLRPDEAAQVEARVLARLLAFLHPLTGGPTSRGWAFGEALYQSHIAALIENTTGVDYARQIGLRVQGQLFDEYVALAADALVAAGDHELKLMLGED